VITSAPSLGEPIAKDASHDPAKFTLRVLLVVG
jgi:hypothetical protein